MLIHRTIKMNEQANELNNRPMTSQKSKWGNEVEKGMMKYSSSKYINTLLSFLKNQANIYYYYQKKLIVSVLLI